MTDSKNYILKGGRVVDPKNKINKIMDIGIENGLFCEPEHVTNPQIVNVEGLIIAPGFIDIHVHVREPGFIEKETIKTGSMAAAAGGFTTILAMPNTKPAVDTVESIEFLKKSATENDIVNVLPSCCITKGLEGRKMTALEDLKRAGAVAVTDDGKCVHNSGLMHLLIEKSKSLGIPVLDHCEDDYLAGGGAAHDGAWTEKMEIKTIPSSSEVVMVVRDIIIAEELEGQVHIQHVSAAESVRYIREAQERGVAVTVEATPHHIALTDESVKTLDTNHKMNPPLRSENDRKSIIEGLKDGTISVIATDHAPHTEIEKSVDFASAPFGIIGLETAVPVCLSELYHKGILNISEFISKFTKGPAEVLNLDAGSIELGKKADITILNLDIEHRIDKNKFYSKSKNTPFHEWNVKGKAVATIVGGKFIYSELEDVKGII